MAWENTGSGTAERPVTSPPTGLATRSVVETVTKVLNVAGYRVRFRADDDLHRTADAYHAVYAQRAQRGFVHQGVVLKLTP
ncbi:hypothetical protein GCM10029964_032250 [Kibdelosporangium lantanae]